jgi:hypothetical protein
MCQTRFLIFGDIECLQNLVDNVEQFIYQLFTTIQENLQQLKEDCRYQFG